MRVGDIILEVNRQPVESVKEVKEAFTRADANDSLLLLLKRGEGSLFVALAQQA